MTGCVTALASLTFLAQGPPLREGGLAGAALVVVGLALIWTVPRVVRSVPAPLVAITVLTLAVVVGGLHVPTVGDEGELPHSLPVLGLPSVPFSLHTLTVVAPYSITLAFVGLLESLMTARLVDEITDTGSDKLREARGQGVANVVTGLFGGLPGCAMIGQTMINVRASGARTRVSTFCAGFFLLVLVVGLGGVVAAIPMAALVAVMILVSVSTFEWHSIVPRTLGRTPPGETAAMLATVAATVATGNLAIGVALGVLVTMGAFVSRVSRLVRVERVLDPDGTTSIYAVSGEVFFASEQALVDGFAPAADPANVIVDLSRARLWDRSGLAALRAIQERYARQGIQLRVTGLGAADERVWRDLAAPELPPVDVVSGRADGPIDLVGRS
jgi:SulP family sulfate permease